MSYVGDLLRDDAAILAAADEGMGLLAQLTGRTVESNQLSRDSLVIVAAWFDEHPDAASEVEALLGLV